MPDDPRQTNGTVSGIGPATRPGVPQGYSVTSTSTPPTAPLYGERSTPVTTLADMARHAGARDQTSLSERLTAFSRLLEPVAPEHAPAAGRPVAAGYSAPPPIAIDELARRAGKR
jgi:hypothetical protein